MLDKKQIKLEVSKSCAADPGLAEAITLAMGEQVLWSKLDIVGTLRVWLAYKSLTDREPSYYNAFLALTALISLQTPPVVILAPNDYRIANRPENKDWRGVAAWFDEAAKNVKESGNG